MPFKGFLCEATGAKTAVGACLACARNGALAGCHMTAPVVKGILDRMRPEGFGLTITVLLGCPRKQRLQPPEDYWLKPSEAWWAFRGQLMHGVAAEYAADDPLVIAETRFTMIAPDGETTISGQPDLVIADRHHLIDFKTTKAVPGPARTWTCPETDIVIRESQFNWRNRWMDCRHCGSAHEARAIETTGQPRAYLRHVQQVSLYALLLWENGIEIETAEIVYQDMRTQLRVPVELLPLDEARALLEARLEPLTQPDLPDILTSPEDLWECDFCPVRAACENLHGGPVGKRKEE